MRSYTVAAGAVVVVVVVEGMRRYELQNDVAGGPSAFNIVRAAFTALQSGARCTSPGPVGMGAGKGLAETVIRIHAEIVNRYIVTTQALLAQ